MNEHLQKELKRISKEMQSAKNPDNIVVMEAMCEIQDLQAKFDTVQENYVRLIQRMKELSQRVIDTGNAHIMNPDWNDPNWQVGYITGISESANIIEQE